MDINNRHEQNLIFIMQNNYNYWSASLCYFSSWNLNLFMSSLLPIVNSKCFSTYKIFNEFILCFLSNIRFLYPAFRPAILFFLDQFLDLLLLFFDCCLEVVDHPFMFLGLVLQLLFQLANSFPQHRYTNPRLFEFHVFGVSSGLIRFTVLSCRSNWSYQRKPAIFMDLIII